MVGVVRSWSLGWGGGSAQGYRSVTPSESPHPTQIPTFQPAASDLGVKAVEDPRNIESRALVC